MLHTRNTIEYRDSTLAAIVPAAVGIDGRVDDFRGPFVILLIGLPVALAVRGLLEVVGWVSA